MSWSFGDALEALDLAMPADAPAVMQGKRIINWGDYARRSNNLARAMLATGAEAGAKLGFYMRNRPEYVEGLAAAFKARLTHVNVNYRYTEDELHYIFDNSDSELVLYDVEFRDQIIALKDRLPKVRAWIEIGAEDDTPDFAVAYEDWAGEGDGTPLNIERDPKEDMLFIYTGGTTGMPKGVMWPIATIRQLQIETLHRTAGILQESMDDQIAHAINIGSNSRLYPICPLMHGTGLFTAMGAMMAGSAVILSPTMDHFDPEEVWDEVVDKGATALVIVGDAFAKPLLTALNENPGRWDTSSLLAITSSGVMWSREVKQGLLDHIPQAIMSDAFGSSEGTGFGASQMTKEGEVKTSKFTIGPNARVFTEDNEEVQPGSGVPGFIAQRGNIPIGYYKDPEKTAKTFKTINGELWSMPGDWCMVEEDGSITLLGRGSVCINTGGEKVYPEEIEECLKTHEIVEDALVVGVPDDKWGQAVTAVVQLNPGINDGDEDVLRSHVRAGLAAYKVPKRVLFKDNLGRAPNGKADYKGITDYAKETLGLL